MFKSLVTNDRVKYGDIIISHLCASLYNYTGLEKLLMDAVNKPSHYKYSDFSDKVQAIFCNNPGYGSGDYTVAQLLKSVSDAHSIWRLDLSNGNHPYKPSSYAKPLPLP